MTSNRLLGSLPFSFQPENDAVLYYSLWWRRKSFAHYHVILLRLRGCLDVQ